MIRFRSGRTRICRRRFTALAIAIVALAVVRQVAAQTFSVGANFTTITRSQTRTLTGLIIEPPDSMGAAGPNHFVAFNNGSFSVFNKNGALVSQESDTAFWTGALGSDPGGLSDPRILYDPASQRWFAVMITTDQATNNKILIARSNTADPTQGFKGVTYTTSNNRFADFPMLALDANGVYVTTNNFTSGNSFSNVAVYSTPKADLLADTPSLARLTSFASLNGNSYGFSLQAAVNYGPKLPGDPTPIIAVDKMFSGRYHFTALSGTTDAGATLAAGTLKNVQSTPYPTNSPQLGSSITLDNGDNRFSGNAVQVGNFLYAAHSVTDSGRSAVRWTIADATTFDIVQQGTISDAALSYFFPSIAVNASGDVVVGFSGSSATTYAGTYAVVGASAGGAPGGSLNFGTPLLTKAGSDFYPDTRWGDFSAVTPDPADPGVFWSHQEYATNRFTVGTTTYGNWGTQATEIIPSKAGERRWSSAAGGSFAAAANYFGGVAPVPSDHVIFSRANTSHTVAFSGSNASDRASVRQGSVMWNLAGGSYTLTNSNAATPSLAVAEFQGAAALTVAGGALNTMNAAVATAPGGNGSLTLAAGATWTNSNNLALGSSAANGTLTIQNLATASIGGALSVGEFGTVSLNGGTLRLNGYSRSPGGVISFTSGALQLAGNRNLPADPAIQDFFGSAPEIDAGKSLVVEGSATLSAAAPLTLSGGTFAAQGGFAVNSGGNVLGYGTIDTPNDAAKPLVNNGHIIGNSLAQPLTLSGYVEGLGMFDNVEFTGTFSPGLSAAQLDLGSAVYAGLLKLELGGLTPGIEYDQLNHTLNGAQAHLGGTLDVSLLDDFTPAAGDMFQIITATGGVFGMFADTILPALPDDLFWTVDYAANSVLLEVAVPVPPALPGDFDGDGDVDGADFVAWQTHFPTASGATLADGDADGDGDVDGADFVVWQTHFPTTPGVAASLAPEPATIWLASLAAAYLLVRIPAVSCPKRL